MNIKITDHSQNLPVQNSSQTNALTRLMVTVDKEAMSYFEAVEKQSDFQFRNCWTGLRDLINLCKHSFESISCKIANKFKNEESYNLKTEYSSDNENSQQDSFTFIEPDPKNTSF